MDIEEVIARQLEIFSVRLLAEIAKLQEKTMDSESLLRSEQVRKMLNISPGTLQKLRIKGILPYKKLDRSFRYKLSDIRKALQESESMK